MKDNTPLYFTLRTGFSCNNKCVQCFVERKKGVEDVTEEELKSIIDGIPAEASICYTGGEPTIRHDFLRLLQYSQSKGFRNTLQSNGVKFADMDFLRSVEPYLESITLPIHSSDRDIFDKTTQIEGSYDETMQAFRNITASSINMTTQTVITQLNYKTLLSTFEMIQEMNPGVGMTLTFPHPFGAAHTTDVTPRYSEVKPYVHEVLKKFGTIMHTHYIPRCYLYPYQNWVVNVDTHDNGSMWKPGTDFTSAGWEKLDYGTYQKDAKIKLASCIDCVFNANCIGIWKEYGDLYNPVDLPPVLVDESLPDPSEEDAVGEKVERAPLPDQAADVETEDMKSIKLLLYRLDDKSSPLTIQQTTTTNLNLFKVISKATNEVLEERYPLKSKKADLTDETVEALRNTGADIKSCTVSLTEGVLTAYNLFFKLANYKLSPLDDKLSSASNAVLVNLSLVGQEDSVWYVCEKITDPVFASKLETIQKFFTENGKPLVYDNLMALMKEHHTHHLALCPEYQGASWAYIY